MKRLEDLLEVLNPMELRELAKDRTKTIQKDLNKWVKNIRELDINFIDHPVLEVLKDNINLAIDRVQDIEVVDVAKDRVASTKNTVLSVLNVPSQTDVDRLTRKLSSLEKKLDAITKHSR